MQYLMSERDVLLMVIYLIIIAIFLSLGLLLSSIMLSYNDLENERVHVLPKFSSSNVKWESLVILVEP